MASLFDTLELQRIPSGYNSPNRSQQEMVPGKCKKARSG